MLVSVAAYALIWGWKFGAVFVALLFIHEIGHVIQLKREGVPASAPMFIPFLGAFVAMKQMPKDAAAEARVGLAGPVLGSLGCLIPLAIWQATGSDFWQAATFIGLFLNLFNLLPILPLDGGRAMAALSSWIWAIGFVLFLGVLVVFPSPVIILIVLLRRHGDVAALEAAQDAGGPGVQPRRAAHADADRAGLPRRWS